MKYSYTFLGLAALASAQDFTFTSIYNVTATPGEVVNSAGVPAPGAIGARGQFNYAIDSVADVICYDITLQGVAGEYLSPAKTATHIHEGVKGSAGPPRIAFPNPVGDDNIRHSEGCLIGPFTTGIRGADNITDTGAGFRLAQIEANPAGFFTDSHTVLFPAGVVRGQLDFKFELIKPQPVGYPSAPVDPTYPTDGYPSAPVDPTYPTDGYPSDPAYPTEEYPSDPAYPTTTGYPEAPVYPVTDDYDITTATCTKAVEYTISQCPDYVVDCPYKTKPVVTQTYEVYTTVCPKSDVPTYYTETVTKPYQTYPAETYPVETHPVETFPVVPKPAETNPAGYPKPAYPVETYPAGKPTTVQTYKQPAGTGSVYPPYATFTGAAGANKVGGLLIAAGLAAALL